MGIAAAVGAGVAAAASAIGAAAASITLVGALEVTAALGATLGVVGTITGNKGLAMAGLALGIVGGVGSLAASAGLFGAEAGTAPLFGDAADAGSNVTALAQDTSVATDASAAGTAADTLDPAAAATSAADPASAITDAANPAASGAPGDIVDSVGKVDAASAIPSPATDQTQALTANSLASNGQQNSLINTALNNDTAATQGASATTLPPNQVQIPDGAGVAPPSSPGAPDVMEPVPPEKPPIPGGAFDASISSNGGILSNLLNFANKSPTATLGLIQAGGSFASGLFSPVTPAQVNALNAQAAANNASAGLTNTQVANIKSGVPTATVQRPGQPLATNQAAPTSPVTGTPASVMPQIGLINQPQQQVA